MSDRKKKYEVFDYESWEMIVSASQIETFNDCARKWCFEKIWKLKAVEQSFTNLGTVFHSVCERWLLADDNGRVPLPSSIKSEWGYLQIFPEGPLKGQQYPHAVEVFPEGWDETISYGEAAVVKKLFQSMVDEGILRRTPGRVVEKPIQMEVIGGNQVSLIGYEDVWTPLGIEDHKTSSNSRWFKTRQGLRENIQIMAYAAAWIEEALEADRELPETIELRHNQACVDPDATEVRKTCVDVSPNEIIDFWEKEILPRVRQMLHWKRSKLPETSWEKVPGPKTKGVCRKYRGCPFMGICGRTESVQTYRGRFDLHTKQVEAHAAQEKEMSDDLLDRLARKKKARNSAGVTTTPAAAPAKAAETEPVTAAVEETAKVADDVFQKAPWGTPGCKGCGGTGMSLRDGTLCLPCAALAPKLGIRIKDFDINTLPGLINILRDDVLLASIPFVQKETKAKAKDKPKAKAPAPAKKPAAKVEEAPEGSEAELEASEAPETSQEAAEETPAQAASPKKARAKKAFTLLYGLPKRHGGKVIDLTQVMHEFGQLLAEEWDGTSYWALDVWKRREAMAHKAEAIAETLGTALVVVSNDQKDLTDLAAALEPYATNVYGSPVR